MKKNREKLTDAFGMLREDTLADCVVDTYVPHRAAIRGAARRRVALIAAACMTFALLAGALLALPFLRAEEPVTQPPLTDAPPVSEFAFAYYDAPLVNVQVLALSEEDATAIENKKLEIPQNQDVAMVVGTDLTDSQVYVYFTVEEGETVTATSHNSKMNLAQLTNFNDKVYYDTVWEQIMSHYAYGNEINHVGAPAHEIIIRPPSAVSETETAEVDEHSTHYFLKWGGGNRYYPAMADTSPADEDFIDFIIRDENGRITGAGCVYLGNRKLIHNTESRYYDIVSITRGKVLGSVRFEDPDNVTEEQVTAYLESLHEEADGLRETLFENLNLSERLTAALADVINTHYDTSNTFGMMYGCSSTDTYLDISIFNNDYSDVREATFLLLEDGTWGELDKVVEFCEYCGEHKINYSNPTTPCNHWGFWHERYKLTDGRIFDTYSDYDADTTDTLLVNRNNYVTRLMLVTDDTYETPTAAEVIADCLPFDASMEGVVAEAFLQINEAMGGGAQIDNAVQSFSTPYPIDLSTAPNPFEWEKLWDRYAILDVREGRLGALHHYLVLEDGSYFAYDKVRYECEECGHSTTNNQISLDHEYDANHSEATKVFLLSEGGTYTVRDGLSNGQPYAPVYDPNGQ